MFKRLLCTALLAAICSSGISFAGEFGTAEEAQAMLARAVAAVKTDQSAAIAKFNHNDAAFRDRDLFVFCFNAHDGLFTAHEAFVGSDARALADRSGKQFGVEMFATAQEGEITEVAYLSPVPGSIGQAPRRAIVTRIEDQVCGVSFYSFGAPGTLSQ